MSGKFVALAAAAGLLALGAPAQAADDFGPPELIAAAKAEGSSSFTPRISPRSNSR